ncbi:Cytochrome P450 [Macrophomina phaseolina MS6]|uniref:Cytochrome P450 n=1 Tax=Macrophomina phaseolina (strain MS6) TaxID=1126212 RepID=K2S470_MACPH|nr:Cytochrome P450 [Macrophomina phaseolina MS6]
MAIGAYVLLFALGALFIQSLLRTLWSPLRAVPGSFWAQFTRLWYLKEVWTGTFPQTNIELHDKHGPIVRIAPNEYSVDDPEAIKIIYGHGTAFTKGPWYRASQPPHQANLFTLSDQKRHAEERRKFASLYAMSSLVTMEQAVDHCIECIKDRFAEMARQVKPFSASFPLVGPCNR